MTVVVRFILLFFFSIGSASAEDSKLTAKQILANMIQAMGALNYEGTVVFLRNSKLETMKYFHAAEQGREQERLVSLNSPLREVVRNGDQVSCRYNDTQTVVFDHRPYERSFLVNFSRSLDELANLYDFALSGEEDVAMFPAYVIDIRPKDEFRYARRIWVEKLQFLPLKVAVYDLSGALLEQVVFTEQHVKEALPFSEVQSANANSQSQAIKDNNPGKLRFIVTNPPVGFKEIYFARRTMHDSRLPVDHLLMTDGLASISVYMENKNPDLASGPRSVGVVNFYSRNLDDYQVTAMGEVPPLTVKTIAEGIGIKYGSR
ncbi:MucB/RseB C-terminal domain-containing protein [Methylomicrobium sp. Wu6]|uniref:MucB/RseB C-terminal domain-containing protein n=1 Tax=Methylomicrobium sp. Wu6 TaxID=3107928 RepID=UPI002DD67936|nr:MucB/RseB C-terminal domain-containing protein [Methylomicrobium sp. Wu6]MEC4749525.1 MucB/RseB C-terminal domain-containing protein [Methylomicrobium sp. Wu6]